MKDFKTANFQLKKLSLSDFDHFFQLLEISFPKDEYRPYKDQKRLFSNPAYQPYVLCRQDSEGLMALLPLWDLDSFFFLEHFAVHPDFRNLGLGSQILSELFSLLSKPICLEVELPETSTLAARRIDFYKRNHFYYNDFAYQMPALSPEQHSMPLRLMTSDHPLSQKEFQSFKQALYQKVYQVSDQ